MLIKHTLLDYDFLLPPLQLNHYDWTKKEAEEYYSWFLKHVPIRAKYVLEKATGNSVNLDDESIDTPVVLELVWSWFLQVAMLEKVPLKERMRNRGLFVKFGGSFSSPIRLSASAEFLVRDIGMLLGYLYTRDHSCLKWELLTEPKNSVYFNHPVISGFVDANCTPPFHTEMEPINLVRVQALNLVDGSSKDTDLREIYLRWKQRVPLD